MSFLAKITTGALAAAAFFMVSELPIEADTSRRRRTELVDKMAAAFILQGALDRLRYRG